MIKVLIVDDEMSIRETLCTFLENAGYHVDTAENAIKGRTLFDQNNYDIVVTDIIMPRMTGIELMEHIRKTNSLCRILIMTGEATVETAAKAVKMGASGYLNKPILKADFLAEIATNTEIVLAQKLKHLEETEKELYRGQLESMVLSRTESLNQSMASIIYLLADVVEHRDPYTSGHQRKVGNLAAAIALKLKHPKDFCNMVRAIGYIHDIGKIVVPTEILSKPGKISPIEFKLIQQHSQSGYDMLSKVVLPHNFAVAVSQHHERMDGSGYPNNLKGDEILMESHILIVADVVEAMMSHRPYRPALGIDLALEEITLNRTSKYHPQVVDACLDLFRDNHYTLDDSLGEIHIPI
ncbi:MAG: two-component system response regulator [Firmicutes bacterium HGW-Firmicutes-20]|jgi:response regulator RpfG family c-di-GMP phosphodiesterase|nr:MAG: two-component system response regulator [Firmicutes bacterium HGW-Firmicutes-20]PKM87800.1 MAG: two-component system response regulator [Firmicutes bacterium HGW-Firmicutes-10]